MNKKISLILISSLFTAVSLTSCDIFGSNNNGNGDNKPNTPVYDPDGDNNQGGGGTITPAKTFADALAYDYSGLYSYSYILYGDGEMSESAYYKENNGIYAVYDQTYAEMGYDDPITYYTTATIKGVKDDYTYWEGIEGKTVAEILDYVTESYTSISIKLNGVTTSYSKAEVLANAELLADETYKFEVVDEVLNINLDARGNYTYYHSGWIANGYRDADLGMHHAYFSLERFLANITVNDVEEIAGYYFVKETSLDRINETCFEFYTTPFAAGVDLTAISFSINSDTGALTKIIGSVSDDSDDGVIIEIYSNEEDKIQAQAQLGGLFADEFPAAPYWNSDSDRNVYTYAEMSPTYVPDVWASSLELKTPEGYELTNNTIVLEIGESLDLNCVIAPANVNRVDLDWVVVNEDVAVVDYKANSTKNHKYISGVGAGETEVYVKAQIADGSYIESNKFKVEVLELPEIDKTNAVYDLEITGSQFAKEVDGETENKNVTIFNAVNLATQTEIKNAPYEITGHNVATIATSYSEAFKNSSGFIAYAQPLSQDYMNNGFYSEMVFDFDDQQVVSIDFYWALRFSNQRGSFSWLTDAYISTSNDGETWSTPIDMKAEMAAVVDTYNLNYYAFAKIMHREFDAASMVKIYYKSSHVGGYLDIAMKDFVFKYDNTCNKHDGEEIPVTALAAAVDNTTLKIGETANASVEHTPSNASNKAVTWVSSNTDVATVDSFGKVTAVAEGTAQIYAKAYNAVESNKVTVTVLGQEELDSKYVGKKFFVTGASNQKGDKASRDLEFVINSATAATLTVKKSGEANDVIAFTYWTTESNYFEFKDANGYMLKLKYSNFSNAHEFFYENASYNFKEGNGNAIELEEYINLTKLSFKINSKAVTTFEMFDSDTQSFYIEKTPSTATLDVDDALVYSEDESVLQIEEGQYSGYVLVPQEVSSETDVTVYAELGDVTAELVVTVKPTVLATSISVTAAGNKTTLAVNETVQLTATTNPAVVSKKNITWTSDTKSVATVNKDGLVTAVTAGTAKIKATDSVSGKVGEITITVSGSATAAELVGSWTFTFTDDNSEEMTLTIDINSGINAVKSDSVAVGTATDGTNEINLYLSSHTGKTYVLQAYDSGNEFFITVVINDDSEVTSATLSDESGYGVLMWNSTNMFSTEAEATSIVANN